METVEEQEIVIPDDPTELRTFAVGLLAENRALKHERLNLLERLRLQAFRRFGQSRDFVPDNQLSLGFNEAEAICDAPAAEPEEPVAEVSEEPAPEKAPAKKRGRKPLPAHLPRVIIEHDLTEAEKQCSCCQQPMNRIGCAEVSEQLDIIPARMQVLVHTRPKYACTKCKDRVVNAPMPPQPIPKSNASPNLLAWILVAKYMDALPLHRQERILLRHGIEISRATLANWVIAVSGLIEPLIQMMRQHMLVYVILCMDETRVQVLKEKDRKATSQSWMWVQRGGPPGRPAILFHYEPSRSAEVAAKLIDGFSGILQTDGYPVYDSLARRNNLRQAGCMTHSRRKFIEAVKGGSKKDSDTNHAARAVAWIRKLYAIEKVLKDASAEERKRVRQEQAKPILDQMRLWLDQTLPLVSSASLTGKALRYMDNQWQKLIFYIEDGRLEIDNNLTEQAIRPFAIGRKNWLFCDTPKGATASANIYSLIESARANGHEPWHYLAYLLKHLPAATTDEQKIALLPYNLKPEQISAGGISTDGGD